VAEEEKKEVPGDASHFLTPMRRVHHHLPQQCSGQEPASPAEEQQILLAVKKTASIILIHVAIE
jgi:hypothetical protein